MNEKVRIVHRVFLILVLMTVSGVFLLTAESGSITLGEREGWHGLRSAEHISYTQGKEGYGAWKIAEKEVQVTGETDVLINFNNSRFYDEAGNYDISVTAEDKIHISNQGDNHGISVLFRGDGGLLLKGGPGALFGKKGLTGSFTISFWLNPSVVDSGEQILTWQSSRNLTNYLLYQMIVASFENNHMNWLFTNIFDTYSDENHTVELTGKSIIVPDTWSYHQLVYNAETGLLEYLVDGRIEDMVWVTDTEHQSGTVYPAHLGVVADIKLCPEYTGKLDDFCILTSAVDTSVPQRNLFDRYERDGGRFTTEIFRISENGVKIKSVHVTETVPPETDTSYFIRWDNQPYGWTETEPVWHEFTDGQSLLSLQEKFSGYFQIQAYLYTDGKAEKTPVVSGFTIDYDIRELPFAPYTVRAEAGTESVSLSWKESPSETADPGSVGGYLVYYGERPGEYLGTVAVEGESPIDCGKTTNVTIHGLKNGKMYYFSVSAYSKDEPVVLGPLSQEVSARPGSKK